LKCVIAGQIYPCGAIYYLKIKKFKTLSLRENPQDFRGNLKIGFTIKLWIAALISFARNDRNLAVEVVNCRACLRSLAMTD